MVDKKTRICLLSILIFLLFLYSAQAACTDNDGDGFGAEYVTATGNSNGGNHYSINKTVNTSNTLAQSFSTAKDAAIVRVGVRLNRCFPNINNITVQIRADLNKPNDFLAQYNIPRDEIPQGPNGGWHYKQVNFNVGGGKTYYLAVGSPPAGKNPHCWIYNKSGDPYKNGQLFENGAAVDGGKSDAVFELFTAGDLTECPHRNIADCNDSNANILPPYYGQVINNNTYLCPGFYNVTGAIAGITFNQSNIKIVCQNTTINNNNPANGLHAIGANNLDNISITGCTIQNYNRSYGIYIRNLQNANITSNTFIHNGEGIAGINTINIWIYNNSFYNHSDPFPQGFGLLGQQGVYNWTIQKNYFENSATADLVLYNIGSGNLVENNTCNSAGPGGIVSMGVNDTIIRGNTAYGHTGGTNLSKYGYGIITATVDLQPPVIPEYRTWIYNNTIYNNDVGIALLGNDSVAENNTVYNNTYGIFLQNQSFLIAGFVSPAGHNNTIRKNNIHNNTNGIYMNHTNYNTLNRNNVTYNQQGICFVNCFNTTATNNIFLGNTKEITIQGGLPATKNQIQNTTINTLRTSFDYKGYFNITHGSMQGTVPYGKASISKFIEITNNTNLVPSPFVNLTIYYTAADLNNIKKESSLRIYRYNNNRWTMVPGSTVNTTANHVKADLTSFSMFGVFGQSTSSRGAAGGGGGGSARRAYENTIIEQTQEKLPETEQESETKNQQTKEKQKTTAEQENPQVRLKMPEINKEFQTPDREQTILQYFTNTKAILPGILAIALLFGAASYLTFIKSPIPNQHTHKPSRRKDRIELEKQGFKIKKK